MQKNNFIFLLFFILASCATTSESGNNEKAQTNEEKSSKEKNGEESTAKQDVKEIDLNYSKGFKLSEKKGKIDCNKYLEIEKEDWRGLVESALSCIYDKNWSNLSKVADILSHNHLKAPWGPYYKSIVASERFRDYQRAEWMINLAAKKSPKNDIINYQLARIYWNTNRKPQAYDLMEEIRKKDPNNSSVLRFLGDVEYRDRNFKKTLKHYSKIIPKFSRDLEFRAALATSYFYTDQKEKSLSH